MNGATDLPLGGTPATQAPPGIVPQLLTTRQAAQLAGVSERTWWAWSRSGLAPRPIAIGHGTRPAVRYRREEILAWILSGCPRIGGGDGP